MAGTQCVITILNGSDSTVSDEQEVEKEVERLYDK